MIKTLKAKVVRYMAPSLGMSTIFQLSLFYAIYLGIQLDVGLIWWVSSVLVSYVVYSMIGNNIGLHRYFAHGHFTVIKPVEYFLLWLGSIIGMGSPISYAITHHVHHDKRYTDTNLDPHGPIRGWKSLLVWFQKPVDSKETPVINKRVTELIRKYSWVHRFYVPLFLLNAFLFYFISYKFFIFFWFIPASLSCWAIAFAVLRQHYNLKPKNSRLAKIDITYEGLHYNHHLYPRAPNTALNKGEIDYTYQLSKIFRPRYDFREQPSIK